MANRLLAAITLNRDYSAATVDRPTIEDLLNWTGSGITYQDSNLIQFDNTGLGGLDSPIFEDVLPIYGEITFSANFETDIDQILIVSLYSNGNYVTEQLVQCYIGSNVIALQFNTSFSFDAIRITTSIGGICAIGDVSISSVDQFADFDEGDRILVYWDDVAADYFVQLENNPEGTLVTITSGPALGLVSKDQVTGVLFLNTEQIIGNASYYKFCNGADLNEFYFKLETYSFPYLQKYITGNSPSCADVPIVCDVSLVTEPTIVNSTNRYSNDGSVTLLATSSHVDIAHFIRYSTSPPLEEVNQYNNLMNATGVFTGLSFGQHTFYCVDQYNCFLAVTVNIQSNVSAEYGEKYRLEYFDIQTGIKSIIKIFERAFEGQYYESKGSGDPFTLSKEGGDFNNKFDVIRPTSCQFTLMSEREFQYLGLYSQDDLKYKIVFEHDGYFWNGFLPPSLYGEPYSPNKNYPVGITAIDNLKILNQYDFLDESENIIIGLRSLLYIIALILRKTNLNLNILSAVNRFSEDMNIAAGDDPLVQAYINTESFLDENGKPVKCDVVLESILKPFGAFIQQDNAKWCIVETDSQMQDYTYREFDYNGEYLSNGTISRPDINIVSPSIDFGTNPDALLANSDHMLDIIPAYGRMSIIHNLKPLLSIFPLSLENWNANIQGSAGYAVPYPIEDSRYKGISFKELTTSSAYIISYPFRVKSRNDSVNIKFEYRALMKNLFAVRIPLSGDAVVSKNFPDPPFIKFRWRLILTAGSNEFFYSEDIGWTQTPVRGTTAETIYIPDAANPFLFDPIVSFTIQPGLLIKIGDLVKAAHSEFIWFRGECTAYNNATGEITVYVLANIGFANYTGFDVYVGGGEYINNYLFLEKFGNEFESFNKDVDLPNFSNVTVVNLQLQIFTEGSQNTVDFADLDQLQKIVTSTKKVGYKIRGKNLDDPTLLAWYNLRSGSDSDDGIILGLDYNGRSNAVVWEKIIEINKTLTSEITETFEVVKETLSVDIQNVLVTFLPNRVKPVEKETLTFVNNPNYQEKLEYEIDCGDIPSNIINDEIYVNIFRYADGSATFGWKRKLIAENASVQSLLLKNIGNQYNKPTWRINGSFLIPNGKFTSIISQKINSVVINVLNPEFLSVLTPWENFGAGTAWVNPDGTKAFAEGVTTNTQYLRQPVDDLVPGARVRIDFKLMRENSSGVRIDKFLAVLFDGVNVIQKVLLYDGISNNQEMIRGVLFNIDQPATHISFQIETIVSGGTCDYSVDYFRVKGVDVVRYYYFNAFSRSDRNNMYGAELVQLIPMIKSTDTDIDDTGGGETGGDDTPGNGGGGGGSGFDGAFSEGWATSFEVVYN